MNNIKIKWEKLWRWIRNTFANNISTDIKLSNAQISKIIQSGGSFGSWLANLGKKSLSNVVIPLAKIIYLD